MKITLALSGGGIKGFAHIGALRVLVEEGFSIRGVAGSSVGGLVGAFYAAGFSPDEMEARLREVDQGNLFARMHGDGPSLLRLAGLIKILNELLGERTFADLHLPLAITATDLKSGMPVVIKHGRVIDAVLASSAVPGVFPSRHKDGQILVDGGVMNPIPVAEARRLYPDAPVVAVVLAPPLGWQKDAYDGSSPNLTMLMTNLPLVYRLAGRLRLAQAFNLFLHSMDLTGLMLLEKQLELEHPDVIIRPKLGPIGLIDRVDIPEVIKSGEVATRNILPELRKLGSWQSRFKQKVSRSIFHP